MDKTNLPPLPEPARDGFFEGNAIVPHYTAEQMREYAARAVREAVPDAAPTLQGIPVVENPAMPADTWVLVPREPTPEMLHAPSTIVGAYAAGLIYDRMLAAAPTQDQENGS